MLIFAIAIALSTEEIVKNLNIDNSTVYRRLRSCSMY